MTDKEFKKLRRSELIEIIYELQKREEALNEEMVGLKAKLGEKELKISESGSLAEATARINGLFEAAQKTADDYIEQIKLRCTKEITEAARKEAEEIIAAARKKAEEIKKAPPGETPRKKKGKGSR
jgi:cell division septum initiation protein DivIVA